MKSKMLLSTALFIVTFLFASVGFAQVDVALQYNIPVFSLSGSSGTQLYYKISVPAGQRILVVKTYGGSGDCDLYVKVGSRASTSTYNGKSNGSSTIETVTINNPSSGTWYITLRGYTSFYGVSLIAFYSSTGAFWDFASSTAWGVPPLGWTDGSTGQHTYRSTNISGRTCLQIRSSGNTWDRVKVRTISSSFTTGTYEWKVFVPSSESKASNSIGAFINSPTSKSNTMAREIDFEIGYGTEIERRKYQIPSGKLMCYMTVQRDDSSGTVWSPKARALDPNNWYHLKIVLSKNPSNLSQYLVSWKIRKEGGPEFNGRDDYPCKYGPSTTPFYIYASVENFENKWIGDIKPTLDKNAYFDYISYQ